MMFNRVYHTGTTRSAGVLDALNGTHDSKIRNMIRQSANDFGSRLERGQVYLEGTYPMIVTDNADTSLINTKSLLMCWSNTSPAIFCLLLLLLCISLSQSLDCQAPITDI